jgi:hypothetical protein
VRARDVTLKIMPGLIGPEKHNQSGMVSICIIFDLAVKRHPWYDARVHDQAFRRAIQTRSKGWLLERFS